MLRCFHGDKTIKVHVANGSKINIWCRIAGDKMLKVQGETGGGFDMHGFGFNANKAEEFQHVAGATRGYSQIQRGNTLEFEASTSSNSVYMTVINKSGSTICKNHEISRSRNYVINHLGALLDAKKNKWMDTTGCNHAVSNDDIGEYDTERKDTDYVGLCLNEFRVVSKYDNGCVKKKKYRKTKNTDMFDDLFASNTHTNDDDDCGFDPKPSDKSVDPGNVFSQTCDMQPKKRDKIYFLDRYKSIISDDDDDDSSGFDPKPSDKSVDPGKVFSQTCDMQPRKRDKIYFLDRYKSIISDDDEDDNSGFHPKPSDKSVDPGKVFSQTCDMQPRKRDKIYFLDRYKSIISDDDEDDNSGFHPKARAKGLDRKVGFSENC